MVVSEIVIFEKQQLVAYRVIQTISRIGFLVEGNFRNVEGKKIEETVPEISIHRFFVRGFVCLFRFPIF